MATNTKRPTTAPKKSSKKTANRPRKSSATPLRTHVAVVLDRSGSMSVIRDQAIELFNSQVDSINRSVDKNHEVTVTLVTFASDGRNSTNVVFEGKPATTLTKLDAISYVPNGGTPMNDGIGLAIERLSTLPGQTDKNTAFLVCVVSDGQENSSNRYNSVKIAELVQEKEGTKRWTFTFLGANVDLKNVQQTYGFSASNTVAYVATAAGTAAASHTHGLGTARYMNSRGLGSTSTDKFYASETDDSSSSSTPTKKSK